MLEMFQDHPVAKKVQEMKEGLTEAANTAMIDLRKSMRIFNDSRWSRFCNSTTGKILMVAGLIIDVSAASHLLGESVSAASRDESAEESKDFSEDPRGVSIHFEGAPDWMNDGNIEKSISDEADALLQKLKSSGEQNVGITLAFVHGDSVVAEGVDQLPNKMMVQIRLGHGGMFCEEFFSDPMGEDQIDAVLQGRSNEVPYLAPGQASSLLGEDRSKIAHDLFVPITMMVADQIQIDRE